MVYLEMTEKCGHKQTITHTLLNYIYINTFCFGHVHVYMHVFVCAFELCVSLCEHIIIVCMTVWVYCVIVGVCVGGGHLSCLLSDY